MQNYNNNKETAAIQYTHASKTILNGIDSFLFLCSFFPHSVVPKEYYGNLISVYRCGYFIGLQWKKKKHRTHESFRFTCTLDYNHAGAKGKKNPNNSKCKKKKNSFFRLTFLQIIYDYYDVLASYLQYIYIHLRIVHMQCITHVAYTLSDSSTINNNIEERRRCDKNVKLECNW